MKSLEFKEVIHYNNGDSRMRYLVIKKETIIGVLQWSIMHNEYAYYSESDYGITKDELLEICDFIRIKFKEELV